MTHQLKNLIVGIGNIYVETNYLGLNTAGKNSLEIGKEYRADTYETRLGGSVINFVLQAKMLGSSVGLIGKIGKDDYGEKLLDMLHAQGIDSDFISVSQDVQTCIDSGVVLSHNHQNIQIISGNANQKLQLTDIDLSNTVFNTIQAVYIGGFLKQESLYQDYPNLLHSLKEKNIQLFMDHGRIPVDVSQDKRDVLMKSLALCDGYFPNEEELLGISGSTSIDEGLNKLLSLGMKFIVVKLGERGCRVKTMTQDLNLPAHRVNVISTVGAGDAFNAGFVTEYLKKSDLKRCLSVANATAALRISSSYYPTFEEVASFVNS